MAINFGHLKSLDVKDKTAEYVIYEIPGEPALTLKPATDANKPYFNAVLKRTKKNMRAVTAGAISAAMIEENRREDKELFPQFVITGWSNVVDIDGNSVPFTESACSEFLNELPDWLFDKIRNFAGDPANFAAVIDVQAKSKNSLSA